MIRRDGYTTSVWQAIAGQRYTAGLPGGIADVMIVGGGITGLTAALLLQKAGKKCVVAEAKNIGFGTTGGTSAHLNMFLDTNYATIKKNFGKDNAILAAQGTRTAIELIERNTEEYLISCGFRRVRGYLYSSDKEQTKTLEEMFDAAEEAGVPVSWAKEMPAPFSFKKILRYNEEAEFHPTKYLAGIAKAFTDAGGIILQNCCVTDVKVNASGIAEITTSLGTITAKNVIYATHIPPGINILHLRCIPYRSYVLAAELRGEGYPDGLIYDMHDPYHYYRTLKTGKAKLLIAGGEDHKTGHEQDTSKRMQALERYVRRHFNVKKIHYSWSAQFYETVDGMPYIGHLPGNPENVFVATGFSGTGLMYGSLAGLILSDLIISGKSEYKDLFDPDRIKPVAGFKNFVKEAGDVAAQFIGKWLAVERIEGLAELKNGKAKVVKYEGNSIAAYRDEKGKLYAVNPVCPHMKCAVSWNGAEQSWDCPCHGSRFSYTGELLTAPARNNLEKIDIRNKK